MKQPATAPAANDTVEAIQTDYPDWHIWRSRRNGLPNEWLATLNDHDHGRDFKLGLAPTLMERTAAELREQLAEQKPRADLRERPSP